jgi:hypothetical protein
LRERVYVTFWVYPSLNLTQLLVIKSGDWDHHQEVFAEIGHA